MCRQPRALWPSCGVLDAGGARRAVLYQQGNIRWRASRISYRFLPVTRSVDRQHRRPMSMLRPVSPLHVYLLRSLQVTRLQSWMAKRRWKDQLSHLGYPQWRYLIGNCGQNGFLFDGLRDFGNKYMYCIQSMMNRNKSLIAVNHLAQSIRRLTLNMIGLFNLI